MEALRLACGYRSTRCSLKLDKHAGRNPQYADIPGCLGWIRLLDKASVSAYPGVDSSYSLSWKAQDGRTLNYTLRTEAGEGPLALLKLRNFRLPETIFSTSGAASPDQVASAGYDTEDIY